MIEALKRFWALLPVRQRAKFVLIVVFMTIGATLEMLGIGALLPVIGVMQEPDSIQANPALAALSSRLGNPPAQTFFITMLLGLLAFFLIKNVFLVFLDLFQYRFMSNVQARLSTSLIASYLKRPYAYHLEVNTAQLIRNVTIEVDNVYYYTLVPLVALMSEGLVVLALFILIFMVDPNAAIILTVSGSALIYLLFRTFRERMSQIGRLLQNSSGKMIQYAQEGLGGVKEIKVMGREEFFKRAFSFHVNDYARALRRAQVINSFPMHLLETIFIAVFVGILIFLAAANKAADAFPLMGVYAAAAFRLIPSLNRIMTAANRIKQGSASLRLVATELLTPDMPVEDTRLSTVRFARKIEVLGLHFRYPGSESAALSDISLAIRQGEMVGFVGRSGSGKTTLVDCILGLLVPTAGDVLVDGVRIHNNLRGWRSKIGYIPQDIYLTDDSLGKNVALGLEQDAIEPDKIWRALEAAQLADFVRSLPEGLETSIGERGVRLSGGQRQRIGIARAMYCDPPILVLDEATSALDTETEKAIVHTISGLKGSKTILVIAHRLTTIEDCDRVFVLDGGVLVEGSSFDEAAVMRQE